MERERKIENEIIVIGGDHYNALGVLRSLGEVGINSNFILISDDPKAPTTYCKYIKKLFVVNPNIESEIKKILKDEFNGLKNKPVIIPTGDPIARFLDLNYDDLSKKYIIPNINETQGMITKHMDKNFQKDLCEKHNIPIAKTFIIDLREDYKEITEKLPEKIIIKPYVSADGVKSDIIIATGVKEIKSGLETFKTKGYKKVMVQEFINYDTEYAMMGFAYKDKVIIPGVNDNINIYPNDRGNTSYSEMFPVDDFEFDISNIKEMIKEMNYTGFFEVETFKVGNVLYFNEMNFRNSANLFAYSGNNINYIFLWLLLILNKDISKEKIYVDKHYYFVVDHLHIKQIKEGTANLFTVINHLINSTKLIYNKKDNKPCIMRYVKGILKRFKKIRKTGTI